MKNFISKKRIYLFTVVIVMLCGTFFVNSPQAIGKLNQASIQDLEKITSILDVMDRYIRVFKEFYAIAYDNERAAAFAVMEIKNVYEDAGDREGAIKELKSLLEITDSKAIRNIIIFQLVDLQKNTMKKDEAIKNLKNIIEENLK